MLAWRIESDTLFIGDTFSVSFERTLRVPEDGRTHAWPPSFGPFALHRVADFRGVVPDSWLEADGVFLGLHTSEAFWLRFGGADWRPTAVQIFVGDVNALTGGVGDQVLRDDPQNYLVSPHQQWLDGIHAGRTFVRQFVATPLGRNETVEGLVSGEERWGGIRIVAYDPKPGRFPDTAPLARNLGGGTMDEGDDLGVGARGEIYQPIYPDPFGLDTWDLSCFGRVSVHLADPVRYRAITGRDLPPPPPAAELCSPKDLSWSDLYGDPATALEPPETLGRLKPPRT